MKNRNSVLIGVGLIMILFTACAHTSYETVSPELYRVDALTTFSTASKAANKDVIFAIGTLEDKTGKFLDGDLLRYSRAVTQAGRDLAAHFLKEGGFRVVERDPYNIQLIAQEYKMSHTYIFDQKGAVKQQAGLIKRGGPSTGLTGANYLITGAITTYQTSRVTAGGGLEVDAIGVQVKYAQAVVGINLRIVDLNTSEVVASTLEIAKVEGKRISANAFKLVTNNGDVTVVSAEAGLAAQFPADFALSEAMIQGMARILTTKGTNFYKEKVDFKTLLKQISAVKPKESAVALNYQRELMGP